MTPPPIPSNPYITVTGALYSAGANSFAAFLPTQSHQIADDFSLLRGNHQLQFGVNSRITGAGHALPSNCPAVCANSVGAWFRRSVR